MLISVLDIMQSLPLDKWRGGHFQMRCVCLNITHSVLDISQPMAKIPGGSAKQRCPPSNAGIHRLLLARDGPERITGGGWQGARLAGAV